MRITYFACPLVVALILAASIPARDDADQKPAPSPVAALLDGVKLVEAKSLTDTGNIITPRDDSRVPKLMLDLLGEEEIVRLYPRCRFMLDDGHPVWTWSSRSGGVVLDDERDVLRARLVERLEKLGFAALAGTPDVLPQTERSGERPFKFAKSEPGREWNVEFGGIVAASGRRSTFGIDIAVSLRGTEKIDTPKLSEVLAAMPTLAPPGHGKKTIPPGVLKLLQPLPVTEVSLGGTGRTWYSLRVVSPTMDTQRLEEQLEEQLVAAGFDKDERPVSPRKSDPLPDLHYLARARGRGETSNCRITFYKTDDDCQVNLYVQP